jgi:hypothetical protein
VTNISIELRQAAYALAAEIHEGKWKHVIHGPAPDCSAIIDLLRSRCPGHTVAEYQRALARGLHVSMF